MPDETDHILPKRSEASDGPASAGAGPTARDAGADDALASQIAGRKRDHLKIHLDHDVSAGGPVWAPYRFRHAALPEVDLAAVDASTTLFGKHLSGPLVISGMTGGCDEALHVNGHLAAAASAHRVAMGVGSQRAALELPALRASYEVVREHDVPLVLANLGAPQLLEWGRKTSLEKAQEAVAMVEADVLALHLNYLQEVVQPEGDTEAEGVLALIEALVDDLGMPILVKETGAGIDGPTAKRLLEAGVAGIDVGGLGGTSFSAVETHRALSVEDALHARVGRTFWDWGNPTPRCVLEIAAMRPAGDAAEGGSALVATGGVRSGLDGAKAVGLGADAFGMAGAMLRAADHSKEAADREVATVLHEFRVAMFLTGSRTVQDLRRPDVWLDRPH